jgi:hypothetical protein
MSSLFHGDAMTTPLDLILPYPDIPGINHWDGCWSCPGHHNCALRRIAELEQSIKDWEEYCSDDTRQAKEQAARIAELEAKAKATAAECALVCEYQAKRLERLDDRGEIWKDGAAMAAGARHCAIYVRLATSESYQTLARISELERVLREVRDSIDHASVIVIGVRLALDIINAALAAEPKEEP